jgi:hypothetical protein
MRLLNNFIILFINVIQTFYQKFRLLLINKIFYIFIMSENYPKNNNFKITYIACIEN